MAVATERGLIVPVIRDVDQKPLLELQRELAALAQRVREGKATLDDLRGGTFTDHQHRRARRHRRDPDHQLPRGRHPRRGARARGGGGARRRRSCRACCCRSSLTFDHRVADGADGARFASAIVRRLEHPDELLLGL